MTGTVIAMTPGLGAPARHVGYTGDRTGPGVRMRPSNMKLGGRKAKRQPLRFRISR